MSSHPDSTSPPPSHLSWEEDAAFRHIFLRHFEEPDRAALRRVGDMLYGFVLESAVTYGPDLQDVPAIADELQAVAAFWAFNFTWMHSTIRCTPAMAAGLARKPLCVGDLLTA